MFFGHAEALHDLERLGQRRFGAGGGERDQERLADRLARSVRNGTRIRYETPPTTISDEDRRGRDTSARRACRACSRIAEPLAADGRGNRREDADRRERHDVAGELEHRLRRALEHVEHRLPLRRRSRASAMPKNIENTTTCRMSPRAIASIDRRRKHVQEDVPGVLLVLRHRRGRRSCPRRSAAPCPTPGWKRFDERRARETARWSSRPRNR